MISAISNNFSVKNSPICAKTKSASFGALNQEHMTQLTNFVHKGFQPGVVENKITIKTLLTNLKSPVEVKDFLKETEFIMKQLMTNDQVQRLRDLRNMARERSTKAMLEMPFNK